MNAFYKLGMCDFQRENPYTEMFLGYIYITRVYEK